MISSLNPVPTLPEPLGPHKVGTTEWEIPISEISSPSLSPDPQISTIKFRIFYPTTSEVSSKGFVPWLPNPQRAWSEAYASFLGASPRLSFFFARFPFFLNYTDLPAVGDAPLLPRERTSQYPVVVFSHGLGGNLNTYSAICTSLASFGIVCVAPEHRDGSAPITFIRSADGTTTSIDYQKHPHTPTHEVLTSRNAQLRIRLWELEQLYTVLKSLNAGDKTFTNYAVEDKQDNSTAQSKSPSWKDKLDLRPGRVTWAGHSFGACTMVQFVKSVYYHQSMPSLKGTPYENDLDWRPLYKPSSNSDLVDQITPESPIALLDLWAMPLRAEQTKWLWDKPLPCYDRKAEDTNKAAPNVVAIVTAEFYNHTELLNRMRAALSPDPAAAMAKLEEQSTSHQDSQEERQELTETTAFSTALSKTETSTPDNIDLESDSSSSTPDSSSVPSRASSPGPVVNSEGSTPASSTTSIPSTSNNSVTDLSSSKTALALPWYPKLYLIPSSAHLSQSDFGLLFPRLVRYLTKAEDPEETIALNVRAILSMMRGSGLDVEPYKKQQHATKNTKVKAKKTAATTDVGGEKDDKDEEDDILTDGCTEKRFIPVPLVH
ncbi:hypothetical protein HRR83_000143 [Exophiala dermatitidis]|uniref:Putative phospholipase n=2 Tax=Exophiala dermatitidis TaxID=5970 RepID=H6C8F6_EXODN|nr:1-alkyl-2-acetylglycerophosphocholine esterase [Exophiala dermatitidis NIH/UT8656]KAJ4523497.1 hypothetical protein HRR73_002679 [Exophiala dermatitidis]EHY60383.1 1-alkyl-2-acetylglycerophosphocholine esterase [Exophiala dermatitidis NIH/UT8656]KAJ4524539.1 hypothetical protein HRR75_000128 [Exophiala dermatitidis]KAJ4527391.1 hypothetical protein HRR74_000144 [Exophiala dermatitidis]KAJ4530953.1 hypothetical protein HRR76_008641 [Exophiala dermatitidis]